MGRGLLPVVMALLLTCGCGSAAKTVTVSTGAPASRTTSASATAGTTTTSSSATATTTGTSTSATTSSPPARIVHLQNFKSPSGNIGCYVFGDSARCDIAQRDWSPPARPSSCQLDYGQGLEVTAAGPGHLVCAGDTALNPGAPVLAYGTASTVGPYRCVSATSGLTCTNLRTGHGFVISRQAYRAY